MGWHPTPTLGSLAETGAVFCVALLLALASPPTVIDARRYWLGSGGLLALLLFRCLMQPLLGESAYAGFWLGPLAVLVTASLVSGYWQRSPDSWLRVVALAVLLAALINALIGFLQYWRFASIIDFLGPHLVYWDRADGVAHGNVAQRNVLASLCLLGIASGIYLWPRRPATAIALEGFLAYVVALTASRTPLVILLAVLLLVLWRDRRWRALGCPFVLWFVVPVLIAQILAPAIHYLLFLLFDLAPAESSLERLNAHGLGMRPIYYRLAAEIGLQAGVWGLGWKSFPGAMVEHGFRQQLWAMNELPTHAHNLLLHLWVENGPIIALLVTCYPICLLLRKRGASGPREDYARLSLAVMLVHSWLEFPLWHPALLFLFLVLICVLERRDPVPDVVDLSRVMPPMLWRTIALALALGAAMTSMQFVAIAAYWERLSKGQLDQTTVRFARLTMNPLIEPYADWLTLNMNTDTPTQRVVRLERLAQWLPDAMILGLLADAYRAVGKISEAQHIEARRAVVFGMKPDL